MYRFLYFPIHCMRYNVAFYEKAKVAGYFELQSIDN